jgi:hypothetical protein
MVEILVPQPHHAVYPAVILNSVSTKSHASIRVLTDFD